VSLPQAVRDHCYAVDALSPVCHRLPWGVVKADPRYPVVWDANFAAVYEEAPDLALDELLGRLRPVRMAAGARGDHVEFWETGVPCSALLELRELAAAGAPSDGARQDDGGFWPLEPDVVMVFEGPAEAGLDQRVEVRELTDVDEDFWAWYETTRRSWGEEFTDRVVEQLAARDREVLHPAGLRWFVGFLDRERVGFASLLSLAGVGYLDNVVTVPEARRRGVASATVTAAVRASGAAGDRAVYLLAEEHGAPQRLYERLGFRVQARVESFHAGPRAE
jgi:ribosomal protein S18 acetylase RimI-like enzyme